MNTRKAHPVRTNPYAKQEVAMTIKGLKRYGVLFFVLALACSHHPAFAQSPAVDCPGTLSAWRADDSLKEFMSAHNCYCSSPNSQPVCTSKPTNSGTVVPPVGGYGSSEDFAVMMMGSLLGSMLQGILAPSQPDASYQQQQVLKQQMQKQKQEALKKTSAGAV